MKLRVALALALAIGVLGAPQARAAGVPGSALLGITPASPLYYFEYQRMGAGGVNTLRMPIFWEDIQPQRGGGYDWTALDRQVIFAAFSGIRMTPFVMGVPPWLGNRDDRFYPPIHSGAFVTKWRRLLTALVDRYGPGGDIWQLLHAYVPQVKALPITTWQIWNEPNAWTYWHPRPTAAEDYGSLLQISARAIRGRDPGATILAAGMFENPSDGFPMTRFLTRLYKIPGIERSFDGIDIHPYSTNITGVVRQIREARAVLRRNGDSETRLWISELGWPTQTTSGNGALTKSEPEQARLLTRAFKLILSNRRLWKIGGLDWYTWRDAPQFTTCDLCAWSGLFHTDYTPKPAWRAFVRLTGGNPG